MPVAVADGRPMHLWDTKPVGERGSPSAVPSNPNSRQGRLRKQSPLRQGWDQMETIVGIDVSKNRLDVAVIPQGEAFAVGNDDAGIDELIGRLKAIGADAIALEATGGFETLAVARGAFGGVAGPVGKPGARGSFCQGLCRRGQNGPARAPPLPPLLLATK